MTGVQTHPVHIGVVGLGAFGRLHARTANALAETDLVAMVDRDRGTLESAAVDLPGVATFTDLDRAIKESGARAWIVATSTDSHISVAQRILSAGLPVLVEKPLATTVRDAVSLLPLLHRKPQNLMMGHIVLFNAEFRRVAEEVSSRPALRFISCVRHRPANTPDSYPGESPFHLLMTHDLYSVLALVHDRDPVAFSAQTRSNGEVTDLALAQIRWENGLVASFTSSYLTPPAMPADGYDRMEVYGDGWAARIDPNPRPLLVWDDQTRAPLTHDMSVDSLGARGMLADEIRCFCRVIHGEADIPAGASFDDAVTIAKWLGELENVAEPQGGPRPC